MTDDNDTTAPAPAALARWCDRRSASRAKIATHLGVSRQALHAWVSGESKPSLLQSQKIEALTDGRVRAADWLTEDEERTVRDLERRVV